MNDQILLQLGVGGIFTVLVLRTVFEFLLKGKKNDHETAIVQPLELGHTLETQIASSIVPILERQTKILEELKISNVRLTELMIRLQIQHEEIIKNLEHLRASHHEIRNNLSLLTATAGHRP